MTDTLTPQQVTDIESHLRSRGLDPEKTQVVLDKELQVATFLLYNLSGQLVGYQRYNPNGDKKDHGNTLSAKYYNYVTKESEGTSKLAVWGVESIDPDTPHLFVTEGIFDAVKLRNAGHPAIAVLGNNPKVLKSWFSILNKETIAITDNDDAGRALGRLTDRSIETPAQYKDIGEMSQEEVNKFLSDSGFAPIAQSRTEPKQHTVVKKMLNGKVKNPETGNDILVKTALKYDKSHPAYKQARKVVDTYSKKHNIKLKPTE